MPRSALLSSAAVIGAILPTFASAQVSRTPASEQPAALGELVVTARRRAEDISKVPVSISAFSEKMLEQKSIVNLYDLTKITPGINLAPGGSKSNPFITIRGQTKGVTGNIQPGVITYVNEVPLANTGAMLPTFDLDNVQVLKGPQGTLFGRNVMGGAILVYSNQPGHEFGGYAKVDLGSYNYRQFEGAVDLPIVEDKVALRLATQLTHEGGATPTQYVAPYTIDAAGVASPGQLRPLKRELDEFDTEAYRVTLLLRPTDSIKNVTVFDSTRVVGVWAGQHQAFYPYSIDGLTPPAVFQPPATVLARLGAATGRNVLNLGQCGTSVTCDWRLVTNYYANSDSREAIVNIDPDDSRTLVWGVSNTTTINLNDSTTLKNIFGYRATDTFTRSDGDGTPLMIQVTSQQIRLRQYTEELQLSGSLFNDKLKYTLGGFYYNEAPDGPGGNSGLEVNQQFGTSHSISYTYLENESKALYGQVDYSLDDFVNGLTATAGLRQNWDSVKGCAGSLVLTPTAPAVLLTSVHPPLLVSEDECEADSATPAMFPGGRSVRSQVLPKQTFKKLTYTLGMNWQITPDVMVYGVTRRGYRAGSYNTPVFDQAFVGQVQTFGPETLEDWEVGTKIRWHAGDMRGSFDLAAFTGKDKDYQLPVRSAGTLATGVCVPAAITPTRPANCTAPGGAPGVTIAHQATTTILNAGELTIRGFEAAGTLSPIAGLTIGAGVSHVDYKVDSITLDPNFLTLLQAGNLTAPTTIILEQQPRWTYNLDMDYTYPEKVLGADVSLNVNYKYSDKWVFNSVNAPGFSVWDARLTFADVAGAGVDMAFYVKNITNNYYPQGVASGSPATNGYVTYSLAPPRTYGVSLKYAFGG